MERKTEAREKKRKETKTTQEILSRKKGGKEKDGKQGMKTRKKTENKGRRRKSDI